MEISLNNSPLKATRGGFSVKCPKCGLLQRTGSKECSSCGIVFEKFDAERVDGEIHFQGSKQLVAAWESVLQNYGSLPRHELFVKSCYEEGKLAYAAHKYRRVLDANPNEEIARKMRKRLIALASAKMTRGPAAPSPWKPSIRWPTWSFSSFMILAATCLIVIGFSVTNARNMVGFGVALFVLVAGLRWTEKSVS